MAGLWVWVKDALVAGGASLKGKDAYDACPWCCGSNRAKEYRERWNGRDRESVW